MITDSQLTHTIDELHTAAIRRTGYEDFGDSNYREGLGVLLNAFHADLKLTEAGKQVVFELIADLLSARLYSQKGWTAAPEIFSIPIRRPVIITGLPRTATTALHRLLAADPQFQTIENWLLQAPMIRPPRQKWDQHPAYHACVANIEKLNSSNPELRKIHVFDPNEPEECTPLLCHDFSSRIWPAHYELPTYTQWHESQSTEGSYVRYANTLRLIGARHSHKRWLLKSPHHIYELRSLLKVFPDACIIHTHRDPLESIPSFCSLVHVFERALTGKAASRSALGKRQCLYWRDALDSMQAVRQTSPMQFFDVDHQKFLAAPLQTVRSIYEYFNIPLTSHAEHQMQAWAETSPTSKHGKHQYDIESWGITAEEVREIFKSYRSQHEFDRIE